MATDIRHKLAKVQFIHGSIEGLIGLAKAEKFEMLAYLLETARHESETLEATLKDGLAKPV
ncbi:hypothetical protein [Hoeflea ulvae]|uniref:Uncharacterized protein n=1 Tax=Hoeflea ulvae TaxID=2983764 RepID=A0ABT3YFZ5_9HYPH|nr:hypothetical protein [Hoeflea ulvae]MCY0094592.1 hypothetical protein [Hoeflea ulvae]